MTEVKKWEELGIRNDFIFAKVMEDECICKHLLEKLLSTKLTKLSYFDDGKYGIFNDESSVRIDAQEEGTNRVLSIILLSANGGDLAMKSRHYHNRLFREFILRGESYFELKDEYIIFICDHDNFGDGLSKYTFANTCREDQNLELEDGLHEVFFNSTAYGKETDADSKAFLQYFNGEKVENSFVKQIEDKVKQVKSNEGYKLEYEAI